MSFFIIKNTECLIMGLMSGVTLGTVIVASVASVRVYIAPMSENEVLKPAFSLMSGGDYSACKVWCTAYMSMKKRLFT